MIQVVAAVIYLGDKILCLQRGRSDYKYTSFKYEFPGGKVEQGEEPETALKREIFEELRLNITIGPKLTTVIHEYPDFSIKMHCYICFADGFNGELAEHIAYKIMEPINLRLLDWIDADKPVVEQIIRDAGKQNV